MKRALQHCRSVDDFRRLLEQTNATGRRTVANFGVLDAQGGAAIFETGPRRFTHFDANDPRTAPDGYLVRSNFATTAHDLPPQPGADQVRPLRSGGRYLRACQLLAAKGRGQVTLEYVLRRMTRDLADGDGRPVPGTINGPPGPLPASLATEETISRASTVSAAVFAGVKAGEDPRLTTMWTILGDPKFSLAVPCWVDVDEIADPLADPHGGELGEIARTLRDASLLSGSTAISTRLLPGIWTDLGKREQHAIAATEHLLEQLRTSGLTRDDGEERSPAVSPPGTASPYREALSAQHRHTARQAWDAMRTELREAKAERLASGAEEPAVRTWPLTSNPVRVAIYDHSSGTAGGPRNLLRLLTPEAGFRAERVAPQGIRGGALSGFDVLVMPGGSGSGQARQLEPAGCDAVRRFVSAGGGYVGICAGSYLASSHYSWSLGLINASVWDRAHWARGTGQVRLRLVPGAAEQLGAADAQVDVYYGQGPLLIPGEHPELPPYEVLATYATEIAGRGAAVGTMEGTHAIIRSPYGQGRVICFSPHPEAPQGPNQWIVAGVRWAARPVSIPADRTPTGRE